MANVLVVDDDSRLCDMLCRRARREGHEAAFAVSLAEARRALREGHFDVVFLDVRLPDGNGLAALPDIQSSPSKPEVIIITGEGTAEGAETAIRNGAWDYICKPAPMQEINLQLQRALAYREAKEQRAPAVSVQLEGIIGQSPKMRAVFDLMAQAAAGRENVLITGETGTGKELVARAIHESSPHTKGDLVVVDCAALPDTLVESVLFGYERGAFTGADRPQSGLLKQADGGTLFLDEVGELPLGVQRAFLRALQERRFRAVGGREELFSDFRLVAATNRDLDAMVAEGTFRKDLLFRLRTLAIELPPLRERRGDAKYIALYALDHLSADRGARTCGLAPDFLEAIETYPWPGNVRELVSTIERAFVAGGSDGTLFARSLPVHIRVALARKEAERRVSAPNLPETGSGADTIREYSQFRAEALDVLERHYLTDLIALSRGDYREACRLSGIAKTRLYELLKKHNLSLS